MRKEREMNDSALPRDPDDGLVIVNVPPPRLASRLTVWGLLVEALVDLVLLPLRVLGFLAVKKRVQRRMRALIASGPEDHGTN